MKLYPILPILFCCTFLSAQTEEEGWTNYLAGNFVTSLAEGNSSIWFGTTVGFGKMDKITREVSFYHPLNSSIPGHEVADVAIGPDGGTMHSPGSRDSRNENRRILFD